MDNLGERKESIYRDKNRKHYLRHKEIILKQAKERYEKNKEKNRDKRNEYAKEYRENNQEKIRQYYFDNKEKFNESRKNKYGEDIEASREKLREIYHAKTQDRLYNSAKRRAKVYGLSFNISKQDVVVPKYCPVLGIPLIVGTLHSHDFSPSLDRIIPDKGYVKGNIVVVSHKANTIKNNATVDEILKVYTFYNSLKGGMNRERVSH